MSPDSEQNESARAKPVRRVLVSAKDFQDSKFYVAIICIWTEYKKQFNKTAYFHIFCYNILNSYGEQKIGL